MKRKRIELKRGLLELCFLRDDRLVLGSVNGGFTTTGELISKLCSNGILYGLQEENLNILARGFQHQVPVAIAAEELESAITEKKFAFDLDVDQIRHALDNPNRIEIDCFPLVEENDLLMRINRFPRLVLRYPDGQKAFLEELPKSSINRLLGNNTRKSENGDEIVSAIDGSTHTSLSGVVSVHPIKEFNNVTRMHKRIYDKNALKIKQDVQGGSYINIPSNMTVNGMIRSSVVETGGSIHVEYGIDNPLSMKSASVYADQHIHCPSIFDSHVTANGYLICTQQIRKSQVYSLNTMLCPLITDSQVYIGNRLFVKDLVKNSTVYMGIDSFEHNALWRKKQQYQQYIKDTADIMGLLSHSHHQLEINKWKAHNRIKNQVNLMVSNSDLSDSIQRFYKTILNINSKMEEKIELFKKSIVRLESERLGIALIEGELPSSNHPEVIVYGNLEKGVTFSSKTRRYKVEKSLTAVKVTLDPYLDEITITEIENPEAALQHEFSENLI